MSDPKKTTATLTFKKETKGTVVYACEELGLTGIYLPKSMEVLAGRETPPPTLKMTLTIQ